MVRVAVVFIGLLTILAGILPFASSFVDGMPAFVAEGIGYSVLIIIIGALGLAYGFLSMTVMGAQKAMIIFLGLLTLFGGVVPLISNMLPDVLPTTGPLYSAIIIIIGVIGLTYGLRTF